MKIPKGIRPEKACDRSHFRPALANPVLDVENARIEASDSFIAVRIPVEVDEKDTSGPIPLRVFKIAREERRYMVDCNDGVTIAGVGTFERPESMKFPDLDKVFDRPTGERVVKIGINPRLLVAAIEALGHPKDAVVMEIDVSEDGYALPRGVRVKPLSGGGEAIVMPVRLAS